MKLLKRLFRKTRGIGYRMRGSGSFGKRNRQTLREAGYSKRKAASTMRPFL